MIYEFKSMKAFWDMKVMNEYIRLLSDNGFTINYNFSKEHYGDCPCVELHLSTLAELGALSRVLKSELVFKAYPNATVIEIYDDDGE